MSKNCITELEDVVTSLDVALTGTTSIISKHFVPVIAKHEIKLQDKPTWEEKRLEFVADPLDEVCSWVETSDLLCYSTPDLQDVYATYQVAIIVEAYLALATVISA